jgi:hypothetical protein
MARNLRTPRDKQASMKSPDRPGGKDGDISPGKRHSSAPSMGRKKDPMATQERPPSQGRTSMRTRRDADMPPDEDL